MSYQSTHDNTDKPLRSWDEVVRAFNQRNPDQPIKDENTARVYHTQAMRKLRQNLANELKPFVNEGAV